jgi:hypothetical protein
MLDLDSSFMSSDLQCIWNGIVDFYLNHVCVCLHGMIYFAKWQVLYSASPWKVSSSCRVAVFAIEVGMESVISHLRTFSA